MLQRRAALFMAFLLVAVEASFLACGGSPAGCPEFCQRQTECCVVGTTCYVESRDVATCTSTCEALTKKDATYEAAVSKEADCLEKKTCIEIAAGDCVAKP